MAKRLTEKDLNTMQNKINLGSKTKTENKSNKFSFQKEEKATVKKNSNIKVYDIIQTNKNSPYQFSYSDEHFSLIFTEAKLLSINQIFAILQYRKYEMFAYKKNWHDMIKKILFEAFLVAQEQQKTLPFFDSSVELTVFRQAPRLVDEDALTTMFKYIIDAFKRNDDNPHGILAEDNPKIVHKIECYSEKGPHCVGIKIKIIKEKKPQYKIEDILKI